MPARGEGQEEQCLWGEATEAASSSLHHLSLAPRPQAQAHHHRHRAHPEAPLWGACQMKSRHI